MNSPEISDAKFRQIYWQTWRDLVFVHWCVPPEAIAALLPAELEPDLYQGKAYVGLVPFRMTGIRPVFLPALPGLSKTLETNLRTYVKPRKPHSGAKPAVWFFSLEAENSVAVILARLGYGLPYFKADMWLHQHTVNNNTTLFSAGSCRRWPGPAPLSSLVQAEFSHQPRFHTAEPNTLEHFLVERYALYARRRGRLLYAEVQHEPYRIQPGRLQASQPWLLAAAGVPVPGSDEPALVHRAADVTVRIGQARRLI
jgi:uncharacterized protein YqjF (DUF2071 family)